MEKKQRVLMFIKGAHPTVEEMELAKKHGALIRNALVAGDHDAVEVCDAAFGAVPAKYKEEHRKVKILDVKVPDRTPPKLPEAKAEGEGDKAPAVPPAPAQPAAGAGGATTAAPAPAAPQGGGK